MPTNTTTYSFQKPVVGGDEDDWGTYLNANWDSVDDILDGTTPVTGIDINSGSIDGTPIGASSASTGNFSSISLGGTALTPTATEFNKLSGLTASTAELNSLTSSGMTAAKMLELGNFANTFVLPATDGSASEFLQTDGAGNLTFAAASGGGSSPISNLKIFSGAGVSASSSSWTNVYWNEQTSGGTITDRTPNFVQNDPTNWTLITVMIPTALYGKFSGTSGGFNLQIKSTQSTATTSSNRNLITNTEYDTYFNHQSNAVGADFNTHSVHIQVLCRITTRTYFDLYAQMTSGGFISLTSATGSGIVSTDKDGFFMFEEVTV
jgi:hypothetical protein